VPEQTWAAGAKVLFRGRNLGLRVQLAEVDQPLVVYRNRFEVRLPMATKPEARQGVTKGAVEDWLRDRARNEAKALVGRYATKVGVSPRRVEVRAMARLWGSCGRDGVIRIDEDFLRLPAHLAEYLAAHEVAHLVHRDHSAAFWQLLRSVLPDARARHSELLSTGRRL
jgi:predicted metal-dependent hydrolase